MKSVNPKVSIYIPCVIGYEIYLDKAIESVFNQTYANIDLEVIIEGKNKKATKICESYRKKNNFKYKVNQKPIGLQKLGNIFAEEALGEYILRLDADDWLDKFGVEALVDAVKYEESFGIVWGSYYYVSKEGKIIDSSRYSNLIDNKVLPPHGAGTLIRRRDFIKVGGYNEKLNAQDGYDIWSRITQVSKSFTIPQIVFYYRQHQNSLSKNTTKIHKAKRTIRENLFKKIQGSYNLNILIVGTIRDDSIYLDNKKNGILGDFLEIRNLSWNIKLCVSSCSEKAYKEALSIDNRKELLVIKRELKQSIGVPIKDILNSSLKIAQQDEPNCKFDIIGFINLHKKELNINYLESSIHNLLTNDVDSVLGANINRDITIIQDEGAYKLLNKGRFQGVDLGHEQIFKWNEEYIFVWADMLQKGNILGRVTCEIHDKENN